MKVNTLHNKGNHLVLDGFSSSDLGNVEFFKKFLVELTQELGMNAISNPLVVYHEASDGAESGVTGTILLAESNITIHTYPSKRWFALDIYSCNEFDVEGIISYLKGRLGIGEFDYKILKRGFYEKD
jgi:S-adenosylmethionine decarboxylase